MIRPMMIRIPRKRPTLMGRGMTMLQFADYVCRKTQVQTTINTGVTVTPDQPKGAK